MKKLESKPYALMAGVCYGIYGLYSIINHIPYVQLITALDIIFLTAMIGMAIALFLKKKKLLLLLRGQTLFLFYIPLQSILGFGSFFPSLPMPWLLP